MVVLIGLALADALAIAAVKARMGAKNDDRNCVGRMNSFIVETPVEALWRLILISTGWMPLRAHLDARNFRGRPNPVDRRQFRHKYDIIFISSRRANRWLMEGHRR
ncbi:hypothetical protein [Sphingopyxis sp. EG6]|uniref:hypothetical protein n=1 Tax=Sphingopyxis sp. EG6 TaxID=1874061 RepID=UPI0011AE725A|nr:hypothetical protein [Sphingopyxis sp. EG6]